ncbi:fructoselysine 3-epimerase [Posidoniimonas polymericola]|uniref:Fructoselysine 3-epimerase n=1 Tax=Posidoniimonas polymericola TaxID=2528002 RepID=A0A5C5YLD3_9BACT|nr:sugar phosphate isomerase/epimerase family protein [Posidoniimonas polymericola]TWT75609.1 fructoselysine 3-epimerase [Posidoniimonas polymericola]
MHRRAFLATAAAASATLSTSARVLADISKSSADLATPPIYKAVKWGMINTDGSVLDKFELCKRLGYHGMELVSPGGPTTAEARAATEATGMPVHGLVDMEHWGTRLSSPDAAVRDRGRAILEQALRDAKAYGGDSVLLVPGKVSGPEETHDHVWQRSITEIRKTLPLASRLGVRMLIENVWNGFCETPEQLRDYLDEIDSPWVGSYFDIGNVRKFGPSEDWIRTLAHRIVKLDVKDWGASNGFCKIGDGDVNWPAVREALREIGYSGWATAEVAGGGEERLADISERMDRVLRS